MRAPRLTEREAVARLAASGEAVLFYVDPADGRGRVLRRGGDGGLVLIAP
ncbi:hypothetical protein ACFQV2_19745 [Actinokineospora soli]|uniref:Uncharacterized protein n=1 Tax=Actinokineospora soli TaxID=1048753 RepID=A0ABW2TRL4_9PSEU